MIDVIQWIVAFCLLLLAFDKMADYTNTANNDCASWSVLITLMVVSLVVGSLSFYSLVIVFVSIIRSILT